MARGDVHWFAQALLDGFKKKHDFSADTVKLGIVSNLPALTVNIANPFWGSSGGGTDLSANQVALATGYAGPVALASVTWSEVANVPTFAANSVSVAQDAGGFSNGAFGVIYNDTAANKPAFAFVDLGGPVGNQNGPLAINWNSSAVSGPILTITPA